MKHLARIAVAATLAAFALAATAAAAAPARDAAPAATHGAAEMAALAASLWPEAERAGIPRPLYDETFANLLPDPSVIAVTGRQPEFSKPLGAYLASQVTPGRVATGRSMLERWGNDLTAIEKRFGVPGPILIAVWGLETNYGSAAGGKDVIRCLATLAAINYRPELYRAELVAALKMLAQGEATREQLRGSWAGAMGQPQFMPSSFEAFAVDQDGDGRRDIWGSVPDALASIANFIRAKGWQSEKPWGFQVALPPGLDLSASRRSFSEWAALGVKRTDGSAMPDSKDKGILFFPAGAPGPAFLVTENFEVLKTYNFSDAYVLSVADLATRMTGGPALKGPWPTAVPMGKAARIALQARLVALGLPVDDRTGRISLAQRDSIRQAQKRVGLTPDGNPTDALLKKLEHGR